MPIVPRVRWLTVGVLLVAGPVSVAGAQTEADSVAERDTAADADTATAVDADTGARTGTDADAATITVTGTGVDTVVDRVPPKIAVVVSGDPDAGLRATAALVETEATDSGLRAPADPALRAALRGEPATEEDGLEGLRSIRRGLGLDPRKDLGSYKRIGVIAGADALVVLRREGDVMLEVFDVSAAQFYEGVLQFEESTPAQRVDFIESRAEQAQLRWSQPPPPPPTAEPQQVNASEQPADESKAKRRWKKAWPYVVAGVLLTAGVTYLIIDRRRTNEAAPPLLRLRPGEE